MKTDCKSVRFIPQPTQQGNAQLIRFTLQGFAFTGEENLLALFRQRTDVEIFVQIQLPQRFHDR